MVDGHERSPKGTEIARRHCERDPGQTSSGKHARCPAPGIPHDSDPVHVGIAAGCKVINGAVHVVHTLADHGAPQHDRVNRRLMTVATRKFLLFLLAALAKGSLLDADGRHTMAHALNAIVSVSLLNQRSGLVVLLHANGFVHSGTVALKTD